MQGEAWLYQRWEDALKRSPNRAEDAARFGNAYCYEYADDACTPATPLEFAIVAALTAFPYARVASLIAGPVLAALAS